MSLFRITFTGIDERCDFRQLIELYSLEPRLEFGILYRGGIEDAPRYPRSDWIASIAAQLREHDIHLALHVCGAAVARLLETPILELGLLPGRLLFSRIQLNGPIPAQNKSAIQFLISWLDPLKLITQYDFNPALHLCTAPNRHQVLFDASGGRGALREKWPKPLPLHLCGYAGGLGPDTIELALPQITKAANGRKHWIDMETGLRDTDNSFCFERARRTLDAIHRIEATAHNVQA